MSAQALRGRRGTIVRARAGIGEMRNALEEKVAEKLKSKGRQRMRPKMGKMEVDYAVLHDAFFRYQAKPKMAGLGDLYYEGAAP